MDAASGIFEGISQLPLLQLLGNTEVINIGTAKMTLCMS